MSLLRDSLSVVCVSEAEVLFADCLGDLKSSLFSFYCFRFAHFDFCACWLRPGVSLPVVARFVLVVSLIPLLRFVPVFRFVLVFSLPLVVMLPWSFRFIPSVVTLPWSFRFLGCLSWSMTFSFSFASRLFKSLYCSDYYQEVLLVFLFLIVPPGRLFF